MTKRKTIATRPRKIRSFKKRGISVQALDLTDLLKGFWNTGLYLAVTQDYRSVVGKGKTIHAALEDANKNGCQDPIIIRAPGDRLGNYIEIRCNPHRVQSA